MSLENAIIELAKAITLHAEATKSNRNPWLQPELFEQRPTPQSEVSFETPKQRKSKKSERTEEVVEGNVVVSVDPAAEGADKTVESKVEMRQGEIVNITSEMCKNLAKEKMASGVDRNKIKGLITKMGVESIADLTEKNLVEFYTKLQTLK